MFRCDRRKALINLPRGLYQSQFIVNGEKFVMEGRRPSTLLQRVLQHPSVAPFVSRTDLGSQEDPDLNALSEGDLKEALLILESILPANRWEVAPSVTIMVPFRPFFFFLKLVQPGRFVKGIREVSRVRQARLDAERIANNPQTLHDMKRAILLSRMQLVRETLAPMGVQIDSLLTDVFDRTVGLDVDPGALFWPDTDSTFCLS